MTDELETTGEVIEEVVEETESTEPQYMTKKEIEDHVGTRVGRLIARQIDEKVLPLMQEISDRQVRPMPPVKEPPTDYNAGIFNDVEGTVNAIRDKERRERNLATDEANKDKEREMNKLIVGHAEEDIYGEIQSDMSAIAKKKINDGWPPQAAVEFARGESERKLLRSKVYGPEHEGLEMSSGGRPRPRVKKKGLPDMYKKACARDMADGIVKDEADYIKNLSPQVRKEFGL